MRSMNIKILNYLIIVTKRGRGKGMYAKNEPHIRVLIALCYVIIVALSIGIMGLLPVIYWSLFNDIDMVQLILRLLLFVAMVSVLTVTFKQIKVLNDKKFKKM